MVHSFTSGSTSSSSYSSHPRIGPPPPSTAPPLQQFRYAREVFDQCDSLRESYWELQRRGERREAEQVKREAKYLLDSLPLAHDQDGGGAAAGVSTQGEDDPQWSYSRGEAGAEHNRWANVRPWDHAMLPEPYLNASTVPPFAWPHSTKEVNTLQSFVASQAPLPNTLPTFWHHLLSSDARLLVNLTPIYDAYGMTQVRKSHQYWPDRIGKSFDAGEGWKVELISKTRHTTRQPASSHDSAEGVDRSGSASSAHEGLQGRNRHSSTRTSVVAPQPDKDWTITRRELLIHPPSNWKPASLGPYLSALHDDYDDNAKGKVLPHDERSNRTNVDDEGDGSGWPVTLLHVDAWADGGADSALNFSRLVDLVQETQRGLCPTTVAVAEGGGRSNLPLPPIWVHCSAGIGRTGTLIAGMIARSLLSLSLPLPPTTTSSSTSSSSSSTPVVASTSASAEKLVLHIWLHLRSRRYGMITTPQQALMVADEIGRIRSGLD